MVVGHGHGVVGHVVVWHMVVVVWDDLVSHCGLENLIWLGSTIRKFQLSIMPYKTDLLEIPEWGVWGKDGGGVGVWEWDGGLDAPGSVFDLIGEYTIRTFQLSIMPDWPVRATRANRSSNNRSDCRSNKKESNREIDLNHVEQRDVCGWMQSKWGPAWRKWNMGWGLYIQVQSPLAESYFRLRSPEKCRLATNLMLYYGSVGNRRRLPSRSFINFLGDILLNIVRNRFDEGSSIYFLLSLTWLSECVFREMMVLWYPSHPKVDGIYRSRWLMIDDVSVGEGDGYEVLNQIPSS